MVEQYSQELEVEVKPQAKHKQLAGIFSVLFSMGFLVLSIFYSWWFMFGFAVIFAIGIVFIHSYNKTAREYTYELNRSSLTIVYKDVVNRQKRLLTLQLKDVESFEIMQDTYLEGSDILCCGNAYDNGVWQLVFSIDGKARRLLFAPDEYMCILLDEILKEKEKVR